MHIDLKDKSVDIYYIVNWIQLHINRITIDILTATERRIINYTYISANNPYIPNMWHRQLEL